MSGWTRRRWPYRSKHSRRTRVVALACGALLQGSAWHPAAAEDAVPQFVREWGAMGSAPGELSFPQNLAVDHDGNLVIADTRNRRIQVFDTDGNYLRGWGLAGNPTTRYDGPSGIAIASNGNIYAVDPATWAVQYYDAAGNYLGGWGQEGTEDYEFLGPWSIALDSQDNAYVIDTSTSSVKVFGPTGTFRAIWRSGEKGALFQRPAEITIGQDGYAYISDIGLQTVQKFSLDGSLVTRWGTFGTNVEQFKTPLASAMDVDGNLWVIDHHNFRIQKFTSSGAYLCVFGSRGREDGQFVDPIGMAITDDGDIFITDFTNDGFVQHFHIPDTTALEQTSWSSIKTLYRVPETSP